LNSWDLQNQDCTVLGEKPDILPFCAAQIPHRLGWLGTNLSQCCEGPVIDFLNHGIDLWVSYLCIVVYFHHSSTTLKILQCLTFSVYTACLSTHECNKTDWKCY
jgi:hypothetical protein